MQYGFYEIRKNALSLIRTKLFYKNARLIRYPIYIRNRKNIMFSNGFTCRYHCRLECIRSDKYDGKIESGENVKIVDNVHIASASHVKIGKNVLMASHVFITDLDHGDYQSTTCDIPNSIPDKRQLLTIPVEIGDNVWIGENVVILKGVKIGSGSIIGANSMVLKDVPKNCIVGGSPCHIIKKFDYQNNEWKKQNK